MVRKRMSTIVAAVALIAALGLGALLMLGGDDEKREIAPALKGGGELKAGDAFRLNYPKGWEKVSNTDLGVDQGAALAAIRRRDGDAQVIVQRAGRLADPTSKVAKDLTTRLEKDIKDFRFVSSKSVALPAGKALSYTFVRTKSGQVQNLTVLPKGDRTYTLNSVVAPKADEAAREVAAIVRSFDPEQ